MVLDQVGRQERGASSVQGLEYYLGIIAFTQFDHDEVHTLNDHLVQGLRPSAACFRSERGFTIAHCQKCQNLFVEEEVGTIHPARLRLLLAAWLRRLHTQVLQHFISRPRRHDLPKQILIGLSRPHLVFMLAGRIGIVRQRLQFRHYLVPVTKHLNRNVLEGIQEDLERCEALLTVDHEL